MSATFHPNLDITQAIATLQREYQQNYPREYFFRDTTIPGAGQFEIGLCLAGSVSAGAYLGGVVDFLIEALDSWESAKAAGQPNIPPHKVRLSAFSGTSGGGMSSLILATSLNRKIRPARATQATPPYLNNPPTFEENPLYGAWVKGIGIQHLLNSDDLKDEKASVQSFLNSQRITELAQLAIRSNGAAHSRPYVADPLHVGVTIGNLNGFAYQFGLRSSTPYGYQARVHEDVVRFAIQQNTSVPATMPHLPNERSINLTQRPTNPDFAQWPADWQLVAQAAMATGAFPVGLLPREVARHWLECNPRILPLSNGQAGTVALLPAHQFTPQSTAYGCVSVDGGAFNNEPFEIARNYLAGILGHNAREANEANRAVIMVDPLVMPPEDDFERVRPEDTIFRFISGLVFRAFVNQGRTHLREWTLAMADDINSRYLMAPTKGQASGEDAICGSVLGAFGGFLCEAYREHDFRLGRRNCQRFLREHFVLPADNKLFDKTFWADDDMKRRYCAHDANGQPDLNCLPIIPLIGDVTQIEPEPVWPAPAEFEKIRAHTYELLEKRVNVIYDRYTSELNWFAKKYLGLGWWVMKPKLLKKVQATIEQALKDKNLY